MYGTPEYPSISINVTRGYLSISINGTPGYILVYLLMEHRDIS